MTLTVSQATAHIEHRLAGRAGDPYSGTLLVNMTGEWLVNAHPWRWLRSTTTTLDLVAGQDYVALPTGLRSVIEIQPTNGRTRFFMLTTEAELLVYKTEGTASSLNSYGAVTYRPNATTGAHDMVLSLWPTPASAAAGFYSLTYQRGWEQVTSDQSVIDIPAWMEPLFLLAVREMAVGLEEEDGSGVPAYTRLDAFTQSRTFRQACSRDGGLSKDLGSLRHGAASSPSLTWDSRFDFPTVPNPS